NWKPESTGTGRFGNWLENLVDWNLSRSRYWGTPLPIWVSEDRKQMKCIGSVAELKAEIEKANQTLNITHQSLDAAEKLLKLKIENLNSLNDLHRPYVDRIVLVSSTGQPMYRESDLIDVWFDSGAMPYAQWHYLGDNSALPFGTGKGGAFPADFISEGVDQTRGWFFTLHALSVLLFDSVAYKNVVSTGLVLDKNGEKMSKRKGNVVNPFETIGNFGADATRWYMITNSNPWDNLKFDIEGVGEVQRKFFGTLFNTYNFFAIYANLDGYSRSDSAFVPFEKRSESDRWILSRLQTIIASVTKDYSEYEPTKAARTIQDFVCDDLSNWYVRLNRKRFWKGELNEDKRAAYETLQDCLETVAQLMSPVAPFFAEWLFQNITGSKQSVHLTLLTKADTLKVNQALEDAMQLAQKTCSLIHSVRKLNNMRVRQPLAKVMVPYFDENQKNLFAKVSDIILSETNVKELDLAKGVTGVIKKKAKPNLPVLGKSFGPKLKEISAIVQSLTQEQIDVIESQGLPFTLADGSVITLTKNEILVSTEDVPGWAVASEGGVTVALDLTLTNELKKEGIARDFVNRIQNLRKDSNFDVVDKIRIEVAQKDAFTDAALKDFQSYIQDETQAVEFNLVPSTGNGVKVEMEGFDLEVEIYKAVLAV
ncbi:MAG: class I tRNA ligase family protein, partial [Cytophagales bacterium]|nr:class I tRNA ligase family protein [Cytophagales bacterium]